MKKVQSAFMGLNIYDFFKGFIVAVFATVIPVIQDYVSQGTLIFDWHKIATVAIGAALAYMMKQLFTNSQGVLFASEQK